ncbi:MAG: Holliday junction resolvase RuvX [Burkholderiales bacterium]
MMVAASAPMQNPAPPRSFLAFDFGTRRVGVATGNTLLGRAQALRTVAEVGDARFKALGALIDEWQPQALVVGVPFHPDGAEHENTLKARRFARQLQGRFKLPVHEVDERYSTTEAIAGLAKAGGADVDAASAAIILDQFLRSLESS